MWKAGPPGLERRGRMGSTSIKEPGPGHVLVIRIHAKKVIAYTHVQRAVEWHLLLHSSAIRNECPAHQIRQL